jgi:steroid delta-isomerase-like uncharacterized protein
MTADRVKTAKHIIEAWNAHDADKAFSFFTEDASDDDTTQPDKFSGPDCQGYWQEFFNSFPDVYFDVSSILACGDHAVIECIFMGTQKSKFSPWTDESTSGKRFEARAAFVLRFKGDKVYEISEYYDRAAIVKQLTA